MIDLNAQSVKQRCDELEDLAFQGTELPHGLTFPEQLLFLKFRYLYAYAQQIKMPPEQGKREKQEILQSFLIDNLNQALFNNSVRLWKDAEMAVTAICKDPELAGNEKVRTLLTAIYGADVLKENDVCNNQ